FDVEELASDRQDRLVLRVPGADGGAAGAVALDDEQLGLIRVLRAAVGELAGEAGALEARLAADRVTGRLGRVSSPHGVDRLLHDLVALGRVLLEPLAELLVRGLLDRRPDRDRAELRLRLALELRLLDLH